MVPREAAQVGTFLINFSRADVSADLIFAVQICSTSQGQDLQRLFEESFAHPPEYNCDKWQWDDLQGT